MSLILWATMQIHWGIESYSVGGKANEYEFLRFDGVNDKQLFKASHSGVKN